MDDNHIDVLQYGNPGPTSYSPVSQAWSFSRDFSRSMFWSTYVTGVGADDA
jgi:hypothetical protein